MHMLTGELQCKGTLRNMRIEPATWGNWARCKALHLRWINPVHLYVLGGDCVSSHPAEKELVDAVLSMSQQHKAV